MEQLNAYIDAQGNLVLPLEVRERLHLTPGSVLNLQVEGNEVRIVPFQKAKTEGLCEPSNLEFMYETDFNPVTDRLYSVLTPVENTVKADAQRHVDEIVDKMHAVLMTGTGPKTGIVEDFLKFRRKEAALERE